MTHAAQATPHVTAYRDLNRALFLFLALLLAWKLGTYALALRLNVRFQPCLSREWLEIPCPLCGMTRGFAALLRGDVVRAMAWNPLTLPVAVLLLGELIYRGIGASARGAPHLARWRRTDLLLHQCLAALLALYALWFYTQQGLY